MKNLSLRLISLCLVFFAGIVVASAQAVQVTEPPTNLGNNYDAQHLQQNQQDLADQNSGNDDSKFAQMQSQQTSATAAQLDADAEATLLQNEKAEELAGDAALYEGYPNVPGFTITGDPVVDRDAYAQAREAMMVNDPVAYRQLFQE